MITVSFVILIGLLIALAFVWWRWRTQIVETRSDADVRDLRTLLDTADESVMLVRADGVLLEINQTALSRFRLSREDMLGKDLLSFLPEEFARSRREALATVLVTRRPLAGEDWRQGRCLSWRVHPVIDGEGAAIERIWVFAKDVTEQRQMQAMEAVFLQLDRRLLHHQADTLELASHLCSELIPLFGLSAAWLGRHEPNHSLFFVAGAGEGVKELAARTSAVLLLDPNGSCENNPVAAALESAEPRVVRAGMAEWQALNPMLLPAACNLVVALPIYVNESVFGVLALYGEIADEAGFLALFENVSAITNHAGLAFEAVYDQSQLRLYEQVLASTGTSVFITDAKGYITWVNEAFVRVTGFTRSEVIGHLPSLFRSGMHSDEFFSEMWESLLAGRVWRSDVINRRRDGSLYYSRQTVSPLQEVNGTISHFVALLEDVTDERKAVERLQHLASHDPLTDLPNRLQFQDTLPSTIALARRHQRMCAILFVDLDRFKPINDSYGHAFGDEVLKTVARRLLEAIRQSDSAARIGGDEFAIVLPDLSARSEAALVAEKVIEAINRPIQINEVTTSVGASIGIAIFPDHGDDPDVLAKLADEAMYRAKLSGRNQYSFHLAA